MPEHYCPHPGIFRGERCPRCNEISGSTDPSIRLALFRERQQMRHDVLKHLVGILEQIHSEDVDPRHVIQKFRDRAGEWNLDVFLGDFPNGSTDDVILQFTPTNLGADDDDKMYVYCHTGEDNLYFPMELDISKPFYAHEVLP